ncbi:MAG TPA: NfeD family protein [Acidimicrobiales bacterium]|nr:NfeD family protein [Acidimicrobiales bacterium]
MWIVAGILLGLVVLGVVAGFHVGPHGHLAGAVAGILAAVWLIVMLALGDTRPILYVLLGADVSITALMGFAGWRVLSSPGGLAEHDVPPPSAEGHTGIAVKPLEPEGIVRVDGEEWSAVSLNGPVPAGAEVQVIRVSGVRLEVWGEENPPLPPPRRLEEALADHLKDEGAPQ